MASENEIADVIVAIDDDSNEALYVDGQLASEDGPTVYACDVAMHTDGMVMRFRHIDVSGVHLDKWPSDFHQLKSAQIVGEN